MTRPATRAWVGRAVLVVLLAVGVNATLAVLAVEHDAPLVALLAATVAAATALALGALDAANRVAWTVRRRDAGRDRGEDTRTAMYRHVIEAHLTSREADDAIVWQIADLARQRLRQVHGVRYEDSPERAAELLGPVLADWVSHDRRHRYVPGARHRRHTVAELGEAVARIEAL